MHDACRLPGRCCDAPSVVPVPVPVPLHVFTLLPALCPWRTPLLPPLLHPRPPHPPSPRCSAHTPVALPPTTTTPPAVSSAPRDEYVPPERPYLRLLSRSNSGGGSTSHLGPPRPQSADSSLARPYRVSGFGSGERRQWRGGVRGGRRGSMDLCCGPAGRRSIQWPIYIYAVLPGVGGWGMYHAGGDGARLLLPFLRSFHGSRCCLGSRKLGGAQVPARTDHVTIIIDD